MENRRGRREIEVTRRRRGGIKRGKSKLASNHFLMCSPQPGSLRDVQCYTEKRRGRKETEVARRRKGGIKRGESKLASNHFPMCSPQSGSLREVHGLTQRREEGRKRQSWPGGKRRDQK